MVVSLTLVLWYFTGTPIAAIANVAGSALLVISYVLSLILLRVYPMENRFAFLVAVFTLFIAVIIPCYSAIRSHLYFGQPVLYGLLSERHWLGASFGVALYILVTRGVISKQQLGHDLLLLGWVSLALFTLTVLLFMVGGNTISSQFSLTAVSISEHRGLRAKFPIFLIIYSCFYYMIKASEAKPIANLVIAGIFMFYVLFLFRGRADIGLMLICLGWLIYSYRLTRHWRKILAVALIYSAVSIWFPQTQVNQYLCESDNALCASSSGYNSWRSLVGSTLFDFMALSSGEGAIDHGLNARVNSSQIVMSKLLESKSIFLLGTGRVSNRWDGGFSGAFGTWYYPSELGVLGAVSVYGVLLSTIMTILCASLIYRVFRDSKSCASTSVKAVRCLLLYIACKFLLGTHLLWPTQFFLAVFLCMALSSRTRRENANLMEPMKT